MKSSEQRAALACAVNAARTAGRLLRANLRAPKKIDTATQHDIKLELDVRCQKLIERALHAEFPAVSLLGEEGSAGQARAACRWVVDPIDGTVNFTYGIPHACVSIALQARRAKSGVRGAKTDDYQTLLAVVYDPFADELFTAIRGQPARLNGRLIHVSHRSRLEEAVVSIGFAKSEETLRLMLPYTVRLVPHVRKLRMMGSAALGLAYVASGRFDAYIEAGIRLWDVAAGALLIECAGGEFWHQAIPDKQHAYRMVATNGRLRKKLESYRLFCQ